LYERHLKIFKTYKTLKNKQIESALAAIEQIKCAHVSIAESGWLALGYAHYSTDKSLQFLSKYMSYECQDGLWQGALLWHFYQQSKDKAAARVVLSHWYAVLCARHQRYYEQYDMAEDGLPAPDGVQDPLQLTALVWSNASLLRIGHVLGTDASAILQWQELTIYSMNDQLWDATSALYLARNVAKQQHYRPNGLRGFLPMAAEVPTQDQAEAMLRHLECILFSETITMLEGWLLWQGLLFYDMTEYAARLRQFLLAAIAEYGFCEIFDGASGAPAAQNASVQSPVTAALYLEMARSQ
jgi:hypothetical protein